MPGIVFDISLYAKLFKCMKNYLDPRIFNIRFKCITGESFFSFTHDSIQRVSTSFIGDVVIHAGNNGHHVRGSTLDLLRNRHATLLR